MLEVNKVSYRYQQNSWLFRRLTLRVKPGEVVGLYGPSGVGKTTLAKIAAGYLTPVEGRVRVDGRKLPAQGAQPVQLIWQHPEQAVNSRWRMEQTLFEGGPLDDQLLGELGIKKEWMNRYPSELSGGELQRFCVARALGSTTKYLIADEMTTMLDAINQAQIWRTVLQLAENRNLGILAISHQKPLLKQISGRIIDFGKQV